MLHLFLISRFASMEVSGINYMAAMSRTLFLLAELSPPWERAAIPLAGGQGDVTSERVGAYERGFVAARRWISHKDLQQFGPRLGICWDSGCMRVANVRATAAFRRGDPDAVPAMTFLYRPIAIEYYIMNGHWLLFKPDGLSAFTACPDFRGFHIEIILAPAAFE